MKDPSSQSSIKARIDPAHGRVRAWLAKIWAVRGGGLYAVGYAVTFAWLEIVTIVSEIGEAESIGSFFTSQLLEFVFRFLGDSIANMVQAFIWPLQIVTASPPWGAIGLGIAFYTFDVFLRKPIERWLAGDDESADSMPYEG